MPLTWRVTSTIPRLCRLNVLLLPIGSGGVNGGVEVKNRLLVLWSGRYVKRDLLAEGRLTIVGLVSVGLFVIIISGQSQYRSSSMTRN